MKDSVVVDGVKYIREVVDKIQFTMDTSIYCNHCGNNFIFSQGWAPFVHTLSGAPYRLQVCGPCYNALPYRLVE